MSDDDLVCEGDCENILPDLRASCHDGYACAEVCSPNECRRLERELPDRYPEWSGSAPTTLKGWD